MPIPSGFKNKEEYAAYMREYRKRKKEEFQELKEENKHLKQDLIHFYTQTIIIFTKLRSHLNKTQELIRVMRRFQETP